MVKTKFLEAITPFIQHYAGFRQAGRMIQHMKEIAVFMNAVHNKRAVVLDMYYFSDSDTRADYEMGFSSFLEAWKYLVNNYDTLQGGGFELAYADTDITFLTSLWSFDTLAPQPEIASPLADFLMSEIINYSKGVPPCLKIAS